MKKNIKTISIFASSLFIFAALSGVAFAENLENIKTKADREIVRRVEKLNGLASRIQDMKNISAEGKASLVSQVQNQAASLNTLKTQIDAATSTESIKADIKLVDESYRIFSLVMPQGTIYSAVDRITTLVTYMSQIGAKLQARINALGTSGTPPINLTATLTDYATKVSDAQSKAQEAFNEVSTLVPDQGDKTIKQKNINTLKDARSKIKTAREDLIAARKDINILRENLAKYNSSGNASSTSERE